ncbi:MAG TPA: hypothetical protein VKU19_29975 [Bryobacteraceae bacterium]|nr:hypothetical protein [Bryobacteraceae bacterium]
MGRNGAAPNRFRNAIRSWLVAIRARQRAMRHFVAIRARQQAIWHFVASRAREQAICGTSPNL